LAGLCCSTRLHGLGCRGDLFQLVTGKPLRKIPEGEDAFRADQPSAPAATAVPGGVDEAGHLGDLYAELPSSVLQWPAGPAGTAVVPAPLLPAPLLPAVTKAAVGEDSKPAGEADAAPSTSAPAAAVATLDPSRAREDQAAGSKENRPSPAGGAKKFELAPNPFASAPEPAAEPASSTVVTAADTATIAVTSAATMTKMSAVATT
ncbi:hypothetical protein HDU96_010432, partial [Phlyctochytrium bullatum]